MTKDVPSPAADFYNKYLQQEAARKARLADAEQKENQVYEVFQKGTSLANEYWNIAHNTGLRVDGCNIEAITHPASIKFGDQTINLVVKAEGSSYISDPLKMPFDDFDRVSVFPANETGNIDTSGRPLFQVSYRDLTTQTTQKNDPDSIQTATMIMGAIEADLQENHTPRSQMPQPIRTIKVRNPLSRILQRQ